MFFLLLDSYRPEYSWVNGIGWSPQIAWSPGLTPICDWRGMLLSKSVSMFKHHVRVLIKLSKHPEGGGNPFSSFNADRSLL